MNRCYSVVLISGFVTQGLNILAEFEEAVEKFSILQWLIRVVTDNASNMLKAFLESVSLPGFDIDDEDEDDSVDNTAGCSDGEDEIDDLNDTSLVPKGISCFAHTLQLCVKDGLASPSSIVTKVIAKAAKVVNHIKKSTLRKWKHCFGRQWFQEMKPAGTRN